MPTSTQNNSSQPRNTRQDYQGINDPSIYKIQDFPEANSESDAWTSYVNGVLRQYEGTPYEAIVRANPYLTSDYGDPTFWDKVGNFLGFDTAQDNYERERMINAREYFADIENQNFQNEFNSPVEQAERLRESGINPDLQGLGSVNGASTAQNPEHMNVQPIDDPFKFVSMIGNIVNFGLDLAGKYANVRSLFNNLDKQDWDNANYALGFTDRLSSSVFGNMDNDRNVEFYSDFFKSLSKRNRKRLDNMLSVSIHDPSNRNSYEDSIKNALKNRRERAILESRTDNISLEDDYGSLLSIVQPLAEFYAHNESESLKLDSKKLENQYKYESVRDYSSEAAADNAEDAERKASSKVQTDLNSTLRQIISNLSVEANKGDGLSQALLVAFSVFGSGSFKKPNFKSLFKHN